MPGKIHNLRQAVIDAVGTLDAQTYDHVPERLSPPAVIVLPGSPYVEAGDVFGTFQVRLTVSLVMRNGANEVVTEDTDDLIEAVLRALLDADVSIESTSTFYLYESNGAAYLAADITVHDLVQL